ncbi:MAG: FtsX-like permease family protein [Planctomycetota bacterium]
MKERPHGRGSACILSSRTLRETTPRRSLEPDAMQYHSLLIRRYLTSRFIPFAAVVAVAFGVFALVSVLSVMEGFKQETHRRIRGSLSHLTVFGYGNLLHGEDQVIEVLESDPNVLAAAPFVNALGLFKASYFDICTIRGIDPLQEARVGEFASYLLTDDEIQAFITEQNYQLPEVRQPLTTEQIRHLFSMERRKEVEALGVFGRGKGFESELPPPPIVVGIEAIRQGTMRLGHTVQITSYSPADHEPKYKNFLVVGAFQTGWFESDRQMVYMPLPAVQHFLDLYDTSDVVNDSLFTGISVRLDDYTHASEVRARLLREGIPPVLSPGDTRVVTWEEQRSNLLQAVNIEKHIIAAMMMLIVAFAGAMIFLILALKVIEKTRDLGVLRSLGATSGGVVMLFLRIGMTLCLVGTTVGALAALAFTSHINEIHDAIFALTGWQLFPPDIYYLTEIPVANHLNDWALVLGATFVFGFLGSLIPAVWASRKDPVKALRYE